MGIIALMIYLFHVLVFMFDVVLNLRGYATIAPVCSDGGGFHEVLH